MSAYLEAKQHWHRGIIDALDAGRSVAEAFAPVEQFWNPDATFERALSGGFHQSPPERWRGQAAADAKQWRRRFADEEIPRLLEHGIRLEPFAIKRAPNPPGTK